MTRGRVAIVGAAAAWSTAGLGQRALDASAATQVAGRAGFAAIGLALLVVVTEHGRLRSTLSAFGWLEALAALLLAISSGTFLLALDATSVANVLLLQAAAPFFAALLGWWLLGERIPGRTWGAMTLAGIGVVVMISGAADAGLDAVLLPLVMTASFAGVIVIARARRELSLMPATCASQVLVALAVLPFASFGAVSGGDWAILAALGFGQMGLGLALLTYGARLLPPAEVALLSMLEVVLGPLWVWLADDERPAAATVAGGIVVIAAVILQATGGRVRRLPRGDVAAHG